jgi:predicted metal-dependent hydrolase
MANLQSRELKPPFYSLKCTAVGARPAVLTLSERPAAWAKTKSNAPVVNLATTVALEHFTAIIAHACLSSDSHFKGAASDAARLWK